MALALGPRLSLECARQRLIHPTQRARCEQFREAERWLERLAAPRLVVPGNHDIPLYDVLTRFVAPRTRLQTYIDPELEPWFADDAIAVCGIDTTRTLAVKHGRITEVQANRAAARFRTQPRSWRVLVAHHPLIVSPGFEHERAHGALLVLPILEDAAVDLVLTGHLHRSQVERCIARNPAHTMIAVHAGTCMSTRLRGEANSYNQLRFEGETVTISHRQWNGHAFVEQSTKSYRRVRGQERIEKIGPTSGSLVNA